MNEQPTPAETPSIPPDAEGTLPLEKAKERVVSDGTIYIVVLLILLVIPFYIHFHYAFFPVDDCLRHAAKAVSGKDWRDILVMRGGLDLDEQFGWHAILGALHSVFGCSPAILVIVSFITLFLAATLVPALCFRRPEAWVIAILAASLAFPASYLYRLSRGRPYILTIAILTILLKFWSSRSSRRLMVVTILLISVNAWIHHAWYLWTLPTVAFFVSGRAKDGLKFMFCAIAGILIGASATGHPLQYLSQHVVRLFTTFGTGGEWDVLVSELHPFEGGFAYLAAFGGLAAVYTVLTGKRFLDPARKFLLTIAAFGWLGSLWIFRFWGEWGLPALVVLSALLVQDMIDRPGWNRIPQRFWIAVFPCLAFFLYATNDWQGKWSHESSPLAAQGYVSPSICKWQPGTTGMEECLPGAGGIVYSAEMSVFNKMFFDNPDAPWRYAYGFESGLMTDENLRILREIQRSRKAWSSFIPWVLKMRPQDVLVVYSPSYPQIPGMIWHQTDPGIWFGKRDFSSGRAPPIQ
jgi:hypothetical protein